MVSYFVTYQDATPILCFSYGTGGYKTKKRNKIIDMFPPVWVIEKQQENDKSTKLLFWEEIGSGSDINDDRYFIVYEEYIAERDLYPIMYSSSRTVIRVKNKITSLFPIRWLAEKKKNKGIETIILFWKELGSFDD